MPGYHKQYVEDPDETPFTRFAKLQGVDPSLVDRTGYTTPGIGGMGNEQGMPPGMQQGNLEGTLGNIDQLGQERTILEKGLEDIRGMPSHRMMTGEELWQGVKDAGSSGLDFLKRGVDAITPSQDTTDEFNRRLQRASSIVNGGVPMYMQEQAQQQQMLQHQDLMQMKRQQMAQHLQGLEEQKRNHNLQVMDKL